jgi:hypothetical protein
VSKTMFKQFSKKLSRRGFMSSGFAATGGLLLGKHVNAMPVNLGDVSYYPNPQPRALVCTYIEGDMRIFESNGVPDHPTGRFPSLTDPYAIGSNPCRVGVPLMPERNPMGSTSIGLWRFGIALNGIPFDPSGPSLLEGWQFEVLSYSAFKHLGIDCNNAHVQPYDGPEQEAGESGQYHYHGFPAGLYNNMFEEALVTGARKQMYLLGDLDECNGREGVTPEYPDGIYHYFITLEFPFVPRKFRGTPIDWNFYHPVGPGPEQTPPALAEYPY